VLNFGASKCYNICLLFPDAKTFIISKPSEVRLMKGIMACGIGFGVTSTISYAMGRYDLPCNSGLFGSPLIPKCRNPDQMEWDLLSKILRTLFAFSHFWFYDDGSGTWALFLTAFSGAQAYSLWRYIQCIDHMLIKSPKKATQYLPYYRKVQILCRYYNLIQQDGLVIGHVWFLVWGIIIGTYTLIDMGAKISNAELSLFIALVPEFTVILMCYTNSMARVYPASTRGKNVVRHALLTNDVGGKQRKWIEKYMKSLKPLKCYIGQVNFVEELTPLNFMDFCISQTVSLLMVKN